MKTHTIDGTEYTPQFIEGLIADLIRMRDIALSVSEFHAAVLLSHTIASLVLYTKELKEASE